MTRAPNDETHVFLKRETRDGKDLVSCILGEDAQMLFPLAALHNLRDAAEVLLGGGEESELVGPDTPAYEAHRIVPLVFGGLDVEAETTQERPFVLPGRLGHFTARSQVLFRGRRIAVHRSIAHHFELVHLTIGNAIQSIAANGPIRCDLLSEHPFETEVVPVALDVRLDVRNVDNEPHAFHAVMLGSVERAVERLPVARLRDQILALSDEDREELVNILQYEQRRRQAARLDAVERRGPGGVSPDRGVVGPNPSARLRAPWAEVRDMRPKRTR